MRTCKHPCFKNSHTRAHESEVVRLIDLRCVGFCVSSCFWARHVTAERLAVGLTMLTNVDMLRDEGGIGVSASPFNQIFSQVEEDQKQDARDRLSRVIMAHVVSTHVRMIVASSGTLCPLPQIDTMFLIFCHDRHHRDGQQLARLAGPVFALLVSSCLGLTGTPVIARCRVCHAKGHLATTDVNSCLS